jgi:hypothetical protein
VCSGRAGLAGAKTRPTECAAGCPARRDVALVPRPPVVGPLHAVRWSHMVAGRQLGGTVPSSAAAKGGVMHVLCGATATRTWPRCW